MSNSSNIWGEMSYNRNFNRNNEYEDDYYNSEDMCDRQEYPYGVIEDFNKKNYYSVENWWDIYDEYN